MADVIPFQGGLPPLRTRYRQQGTGFFSAFKRFVVPIAKTVLPHLLGGVGDVVAGRATPMQALKQGALDSASDAITRVRAPAPRKRPASRPRGPPAKKRSAKPKHKVKAQRGRGRGR